MLKQVFCLISLFYYSLILAQAFEFENFCGSILIFIKNLLLFIFTFVQYAFIFKNANVIIHDHLLLSNFGMAHLIGTNICVWFKLILQETFESAKSTSNVDTDLEQFEIYRSSMQAAMHSIGRQLVPNLTTTRVSFLDGYLETFSASTSSQPLYQSSNPIVVLCKQTSFQVTDILAKLVPFMHPCTIEYSIICVTLFYTIWRNIGNEQLTKRRYSVAVVQAQIFYIDCNKTTKGLFSGILVFLLNLIVLILFIVSGASFIASPSRRPNSSPPSRALNTTNTTSTPYATAYNFKVLTIYLTDANEIVVLIMACAVTVAAFFQIRKLDYIHYRRGFSVSLDEVTEIFALTGVLSFSVFRVLAFRFTVQKGVYSYFLLVNGVMSFIQGIMQTLFVLEGLKKRSSTPFSLMKKKGREHITFLICVNISLWLFYSLTRNKYANILFKDSHKFSNVSIGDGPEYLDERRFGQIVLYDYMSRSNVSIGGGRRARLSFVNNNENAQALKWIIINTISYPLLLYYHFHSSCCLSDMWKECYTEETE